MYSYLSTYFSTLHSWLGMWSSVATNDGNQPGAVHALEFWLSSLSPPEKSWIVSHFATSLPRMSWKLAVNMSVCVVI